MREWTSGGPGKHALVRNGQYRCGCMAYSVRALSFRADVIEEVDWEREEREHMWFEHGWSRPPWVPADALNKQQKDHQKVHENPRRLPWPAKRRGLPPVMGVDEPPW